MKFKFCFHKWNKKLINHIEPCEWSSGFVYYKYCKKCEKLLKGIKFEKIEYNEIPAESPEYDFVIDKIYKVYEKRNICMSLPSEFV